MSSNTQNKESESPLSQPNPGTLTKTYTGRCHCGKFEIECHYASLEDGAQVWNCNCSICTQWGYLTIHVYDPEKNFKLTKGSLEELRQYKFGKRVATHRFCPVCGSGLFGEASMEGRGVVAVNVRSLVDVELGQLNLKKFDGRNLM